MVTAKDRQGDAPTVALLIGLDLVKSYGELPAGFRMNWEDAEEAGRFERCETMGDLMREYCAWVCRPRG
jgi:hypothetical protein